MQLVLRLLYSQVILTSEVLGDAPRNVVIPFQEY